MKTSILIHVWHVIQAVKPVTAHLLTVLNAKLLALIITTNNQTTMFVLTHAQVAISRTMIVLVWHVLMENTVMQQVRQY